MGILDKLLFWRKDDEFDFDKIAADHSEIPRDDLGLDRKPAGLDEKSPFDQPDILDQPNPLDQASTELPPHLQRPATPPTTQAQETNRDLELISSKLDTLKAILTSTDQRIANLERAAGVERKERLW